MTSLKLWTRAALVALCLLSEHVDVTAATVSLDISVSDFYSQDGLGSSVNTRFDTFAAANSTLTGIQWDLTMEAFDPSWLSEMSLQIAGSNPFDVVTLQPGSGFEASGINQFAGFADLTQYC